MLTLEEIAEYAFMAFVIIAIIAGLVIGYMAYDKQDEMAYDTYPYGLLHSDLEDPIAYVTLIMLILGILVGFVSITVKEVTPFLMASIALIVVKTTSMLVIGAPGGAAAIGDVWGSLSVIHDLLAYWAWAIINFVVAFVAPAAVIIAIRSIWVLARQK